MDSQHEAAPARPYVRYSPRITRAILKRVAAGETLSAICRDVDMPARESVLRWVRTDAKFARVFERARVFGGGVRPGQPTRYCPVTAHEIAVRVSEGEPMSDIAADPAMPSLKTIFNWQVQNAEFGETIELARWAQAERMADLGWKMALAATPKTAHLTKVQLHHLRWAAGVKAPRVYGKLRAVEPPKAPEGPDVILFRHFHIETHFETGQQRVVSYCADPDTMRPMRDSVGPWTNPLPPTDEAQAAKHKWQVRKLARQRAAEEGVDPAEIGLGPEGEDDGARWL